MRSTALVLALAGTPVTAWAACLTYKEPVRLAGVLERKTAKRMA